MRSASCRTLQAGSLRSPKSSGRVELVAGDPSQLKKADQSFFDQVIRTGCASRDPDDGVTAREPISCDHLTFFVQIVVFDFVGRKKARGIKHEISWQSFFAHLGKMRSVRAIVAADDE